ncbi:hypothetical protein J4216_04370 [Candidatus Woesearchaeota archaeon]|nr:hypothetical protein [Candidatus Woesearchaeota archaeon]
MEKNNVKKWVIWSFVILVILIFNFLLLRNQLNEACFTPEKVEVYKIENCYSEIAIIEASFILVLFLLLVFYFIKPKKWLYTLLIFLIILNSVLVMLWLTPLRSQMLPQIDAIDFYGWIKYQSEHNKLVTEREWFDPSPGIWSPMGNLVPYLTIHKATGIDLYYLSRFGPMLFYIIFLLLSYLIISRLVNKKEKSLIAFILVATNATTYYII